MVYILKSIILFMKEWIKRGIHQNLNRNEIYKCFDFGFYVTTKW